MKIALFGATSKTGRYLLTRLLDDGHEVTAVGRDRGRLDALDPRAATIVVNLEVSKSVPEELPQADCVISLAHARFARSVLDALPSACRRVVLTGSTRKFTRLDDPVADAVRAAEALFYASGLAGVVLHPSMIYGAPDDRNVNRILRSLRRWPRWLPVLLPLPDGGRHLLQPIFVDDVVAAMAAAVANDDAIGPPIILAGPTPISYADFVRSCGRAINRRVFVLPISASLLALMARTASWLGIPMPFTDTEIMRTVEDKQFDVSDMRERLGVRPLDFETGLALKLKRDWG